VLTRSLEDSMKRFETTMDGIVIKAFPFLKKRREVHFSYAMGGKVLERARSELDSSLRQLRSMKALEDRLRQGDKGFLEFMVECGAVGFVAGVLTGGLGILLGGGYGFFRGSQKEQENKALFKSYDDTFLAFCEANDEVMDRFFEILSENSADYYDNVLIPALSEADADYGSLEVFPEHLSVANSRYDGELKQLNGGK